MYKDYEIKLNAILDKHKGVQKVELGLIDDLDKKIESAKVYIKSAQRLHKADEKDDEQLKDIKEKAQRVAKIVKEFIDLGKERISEAKTELTSTEKQIQKIKKSLKDLGLQENAISQQISEVSKLKNTLKTIDFNDFNK